MIVSLPKQKTAGQRPRALVEFVDIYPTLAELCYLPLPGYLEGASFKLLLSEPKQPWKTAAFSQYLRRAESKFMGRSVRTDRWRYTTWRDRNQELAGVELHDHLTDPPENTNIVADPALAETVSQLARQLHDGRQKALPASR